MATSQNISTKTNIYNWYNPLWLFRIKITVPASEVAGSTGTLNNFRIYLDLSNLPSEFHQNVSSDGGDIRITKADGMTEVPREVVNYDSNNDTGQVHFKGNLNKGSNTVFYIYYGGLSASNYGESETYGAENVWTNGYEAVWHLEESGDGTTDEYKDSTENDNDGTGGDGDSSKTPSQVSGKIGNCQSCDGNDDRIRITNSRDGLKNVSDMGAWTFQGWAYLDTKDSYQDIVAIQSDDGGITLRYHLGQDRWWCQWHEGDQWAGIKGDNSPSTGQWYHVLAKWNGSLHEIFINGVKQTDNRSNTDNRTSLVDGLCIGMSADTNEPSTVFEGDLDEVRISSVDRSDDWIETEYNNQDSPSTFYSLSSQEVGPRKAQQITVKANLKNTLSKEIFTKGSIQKTLERTIITKGIIQISRTKTIEGKARIKKSFNQSLSTKGVIQKTLEQNIITQGRIEKEKEKSIFSKSEIRRIFSKTIETKASIKKKNKKLISSKCSIQKNFSKNIEGKAEIKASRNVVVNASIKNIVIKTINTKVRIIKSGQNIRAKANIKKNIIQSITGFGRIYEPPISQPTINGIDLPFPDYADIEPVWKYKDNTSLNGKTRRDVKARKYKYKMEWDYMKVEDYNNLENSVNSFTPIQFIYQKWTQSSLTVKCLGKLSARKLVKGEGNNYYWSNITLDLIEVNSII